MIRAIEWISSDAPVIRLIDQTRLPGETRYVDVVETTQLVDAISRLVVRGAPALGAAGAYGVALAVWEGNSKNWTDEELQVAIESIKQARPTAVNLAWGVEQVVGEVEGGFEAVLRAATEVARSDEAANRELSRRGADWIVKNYPKKKYRIITHCNTGALATTAWGTALGIVRELNERGLVEKVFVDETRPLLQGSRLTSWELKQLGIAHNLQVDGASSSTILRGLVDFAVVGADRIAANGDTANKIGSVGLALAASRVGIPFLVAAPSSTVDLQTASGRDIEIELRNGDEVTNIGVSVIAPEGVEVFNPAFDVTPFDLVSAIVTEKGVIEPNSQTLDHLFK
ncbi:S-methyl-5-thioribose-1-phosphate isomerase [uncultured Corynebacterium sp.]|uniref:S-methyl-5-thioribose-1-phosphate isomerase n=1 Tax=uncultured Corynebacterium sp. TaxID=159447 RepID=UPI0025DF197E|nr:S-methyl-5-thioribose-1-phosphate isomerase [uncultured Corynebacterium sp.]